MRTSRSITNSAFFRRNWTSSARSSCAGQAALVQDAAGDDRDTAFDRPTSMEFVGDTAYVISVVGDVYRGDNL